MTCPDSLQAFLENGPYKHDPGSLVPLRHFRKVFLRWLDCPALQMHWTQHRRLERALEAIGFAIGYAPASSGAGRTHGKTVGEFGSTCIGNMTGPGARAIIDRPLVLDGGWLEPADLE